MEDTSTAGASSQPQGPEQRKMLAREYRKVSRNLTRTRTRTVTVSLALALALTLSLSLSLSLSLTLTLKGEAAAGGMARGLRACQWEGG